MRKIFAAVLFVAYLSAGAAGQPSATYRNPVIAGDFPDPSVIRVGEDYWATATTGNWEPHFAVLHSRDLVNWRVVGAVFEKSPGWAARDFWAPEFIADKGRFFVYYTARNIQGVLCVAVATAERPEGPYKDHGPLVCQIAELKNVGSIDAFFVRDEAGDPYLVWKADGNDAEPDQPTAIFAQRLTEDGTKLMGRRKEILRNTARWERHVTEGSYILRRGGWFYHFYSGNACCGRDCNYALGVARARKLLGPWEKNPANPILPANDVWKCPGHGSIVTTQDGRDFMLYHAYRRREGVYIGREALLDEIKWNADGWPVINAGRGPSNAAAYAPLPLSTKAGDAGFFDGFERMPLGATWKWPMSSEQAMNVEGAGGYLLLTPRGSRTEDFTSAILAQPTTSGDYVATTLVDLRDMQAGTRAGLAAYGWPTAALGVAVGGGKIVIWRREEKARQMPVSVDIPRMSAVYLRMTATGGNRYRFAYSADGRAWTELGNTFGGSHIEGVRVALTASGAPGATAKFDWLRITHARAPE